MARKPTYEELEQRIKELEKKPISQNRRKRHSGKPKSVLDPSMRNHPLGLKFTIPKVNYCTQIRSV